MKQDKLETISNLFEGKKLEVYGVVNGKLRATDTLDTEGYIDLLN